MSLKKYIKNKKPRHFTVEGIEVSIKEPLTNDISAERVVNSLFSKVPRHLLRGINSIHIGSFGFLSDRNLQAIYKDSSIYVTNEQESESDLLDDIVHEVSHSIEELYAEFLYSDKILEKEFLAKRKNMWLALSSNNINTDLSLYLNPSYDEDFDNFLYGEIGYQMLSLMTSSIFHSPYAATSLREYFADGFEAFFMREELAKLKSLSPALFKKITQLMEK